ncbi:MAG: FAD-dependent oxidoreductase [Alphaproteobacteria bacterium]|nr:FAD-dependent oxidoreductase [Alphaproteobacteria bacterium]
MDVTDALVVGAGAVGLACAYALAQRGREVIVVEREPRIGAGVSSRNSEVIHAGLHYPTGSLKARLCVDGRRRLYALLKSHQVAHAKCGKLIVATVESEIAAIEDLYKRGLDNGVEGLSLISSDDARAMEPGLKCVAAIHSEESGVFDSHGYMLSLQGEIEARGGSVALHAPFLGAARVRDGYIVTIGGDASVQLHAQQLILAPGLGAQSATASIKGFPASRIPQAYYGKGNYFAVNARAPFTRLIYPPPGAGALGIHYRKDLGGQARLGPDLEYIASEDYRVSEDRIGYFYEYARRFWPDLPDGALAPDYAGVRPKIHGPDEPRADFRIDGPTAHGLPNLVCLFGIESPGLTASLAIGEYVADQLLGAHS